ncbi:hypothetical protein D3C81_1540330 [compost metagenome]
MVALQGTGHHPDQHADHGQGEGEQQGYPGAIQHPGQHVAALVVGTQPVARARRAGGGHLQVVVGGIGAERDGGEQHPATLLLDQLAYIGAAVVWLERQLAAELLLGVALERRHVQVALVAQQQRFVVGHQLGTQAQQQKGGEQPQRNPAEAVAAKALQATTRDR